MLSMLFYINNCKTFHAVFERIKNKYIIDNTYLLLVLLSLHILIRLKLVRSYLRIDTQQKKLQTIFL